MINIKGVLFAILFHFIFIFIILLDLYKIAESDNNNLKSNNESISPVEKETTELTQNAPKLYNQFGQPYMRSSLSSKELIKEPSPKADVEQYEKSVEDKDITSASVNNRLLSLITLSIIIYLNWGVVISFCMKYYIAISILFLSSDLF
ncbi:MAG: hypothetical protein P8L20_02830 [Flavobacteriales bacterium]|nr:hypothetical protein [Flavobacteriales bacterium]